MVDSRTRRVVARSGNGTNGTDEHLYWFGGEKRGRGGAVLLLGFQDASSPGGFWFQFYDLITSAPDSADFEPWAVLQRALVITKNGELGRVLRMGSPDVDEAFVGWKPIRLSTGTEWQYPAVPDVSTTASSSSRRTAPSPRSTM